MSQVFLIVLLSSPATLVAQALLDNLPSGFTQSVVATATESCVMVVPGPFGWECVQTSGDPLLSKGGEGGNKYDVPGNLYVTDNCDEKPCVVQMTPAGDFPKFADLPWVRNCETTGSAARLTRSHRSGNFSFNPGVNALFVLTTTEVIQGPCTTCICKDDGNISDLDVGSTSVSTRALIRIYGFPAQRGPDASGTTI